MKVIVLVLLFGFPLWSQADRRVRDLPRFNLTVHDWSLIAGSVGVGLDVASSWGKREANPLYRGGNGRLGTRGALIRVGLWGAAVAGQKIMCRKGSDRKRVCKVAAAINFAVAGSGVSVTIHNIGVSE